MISYGFTTFFQEQMEKYPALEPARVIAVHRESCRLITQYGERDGRLKASAFMHSAGPASYPAVGDWVAAAVQDDRLAVIHSLLERRSFFSRKAPGVDNGPEVEQAVAANFDIACVCTSLNRDFKISRLERFLSLAWQSGASPVILLTKADLVPDPENYAAEAESAFPGVPVAAVSTLSGAGCGVFSELLEPGLTMILLGTSGTGKSSIVNYLLSENKMKVNAIREDDSRGRHTTTHRELIPLPGGAMLIDTPGVRTVGMLDNAEGVDETFSDIASLRCRYSDCTHSGEPGCAIRDAIDSGRLEEKRFERYLRLQRELRHLDKKEALQRSRQAKQLGKSAYKAGKTRPGFDDDSY